MDGFDIVMLSATPIVIATAVGAVLLVRHLNKLKAALISEREEAARAYREAMDEVAEQQEAASKSLKMGDLKGAKDAEEKAETAFHRLRDYNPDLRLPGEHLFELPSLLAPMRLGLPAVNYVLWPVDPLAKANPLSKPIVQVVRRTRKPHG